MSVTKALLRESLSAAFVASDDLPWVPSETPGKSAKLLRVFDGECGFVELLRMEPGLTMPLHRHTGDVHVFHVAGHRELNSGECVGPGDYVYEPAGNVDWWRVVGDEPLLALAIVRGDVEFIDAQGVVHRRANATSLYADYERYCREVGLPIRDLRWR